LDENKSDTAIILQSAKITNFGKMYNTFWFN
jgi:hypothetical protein